MRKIVMLLSVSAVFFASCTKNKDDIKQPAQTSTNTVVATTAPAPQPLVAKFSYTAQDPLNIFEYQNISFTNESTGFVKCVWEFGNNTKSQVESPAMSYPMHGYYTVKLTVWDANGNEQVTTQDVSILCLFANGIHPPTSAGG